MQQRPSQRLSTAGKRTRLTRLVKLTLILLLTGISLGAVAQAGNEKPTWSGQKKDKADTPFPIKEIPDIFARGAVTVEDMIELAKTQKYMPGELVVAIEWNVDHKQAARQIRSYDWVKLFGGKQVSFSSHVLSSARPNGNTVSLALLKLPAELDVFDAMKMISADRSVMWSAPNFYYEGDPRDYTPNDTRYNEQYHHTKMQNNLAWDITKGSASVIVAFTDDGCELTHSDLAANIWVNPGEIAGNNIDDDGNGFIDDVNGWDFAFNNNNPANNTAGDSHGTHVGGIIGARMDNNTGVTGVAGLSTIMPIQFYGTGGAAWTATMNAQSYAYAVDNGAKIVNTSYNIDGFSTSPVFLAGVQYVIDNNCLHINSAGNNNELNPARQAVTQTLLVASTTSTDAKSSFSNYGNGVDIASPGSGILSTVTGNTYEFYDGTSMATPNVAGAAALVWSANPGWTNYQVAAQLLGTADNIDAANPTYIGLLGSGRVNSYKALTNTLPAPKIKSIDLPAEATGISSGTLSSFNLSFTQVMDPVSANEASNYQLLYAGANGTFGDGDDAAITLTKNTVYRVGTNFMNFSLPGGALACGNYRFTISSGGLKNPFNTSLDGDGNGTGGDSFIRNFFVGTLLFTDTDGDGYGTGTGSIQQVCSAGNGFSTVGGDCNDNNAAVNPGAAEVCGNGLDDNCDGLIDYIAGQAGTAQTFSNTGAITIPGFGSASPYPSTITVSGLTGSISKVRVLLKQFSHTYPSDVDILLVGPNGQSLIVVSDAGGTIDISNVNLTLDDAAAAAIGTPITSGTFRPTNYGANDPFGSPAPAGPYGNAAPAGTATLASVFNNTNPNGTWKLFVIDDASGDAGSIAGGWSVEISTFENNCNLAVNPVVSVTQPDCSNATGSINVTAPLGIEYTYSIGGAYQPGTTFSNLAPGNYTLYAFNSNTSITTNTPFTITAAPSLPAAPGPVQGQGNVCPFVGTATQLTYYVDEVPGATSYNWVTPPTVTLVSGQGTRSITVTINSNFLSNVNRMFRVSASSSCGTSAETYYWLKAILPGTPSAITASANNVCPSIGTGIPITYTIRKVTAASSYIWTAQAGTTTITHPNGAGANDTTVTVTFSSGFSTSAISVQAVNDCGVSNVRSLAITRNNPGTPGLISGPVNACEYMAPGGTSAGYSVTPSSVVTSYNWSVPSGATGLSGQGSNSISFLYPAGFTSDVVSVTASNGCGTSNPRSLSVSRLNVGAVSAIDVIQTTACPARVYTYTVTGMPSNASSIQWTIPAQGTIISGQGTVSLTVSYPADAISGNVTATPVSNCSVGASRSVSVKLGACPPGIFASTSDAPAKQAAIAGPKTNEPEIQVFPNPASSQVTVNTYLTAPSQINAFLYDAQGNVLKTINRGGVTGRNPIRLEVSQLPAGQYSLRLYYNGRMHVARFQKL